MRSSKEELVREIETARTMLNQSIEAGEDYQETCRKSENLDVLLEQYIESGF